MISLNRSSHRSPRRSRSRSREYDRRRRKDEGRDSRNSYRSDDKYNRDDRYGYKDSSRSERDKNRRKSRSNRDFSDDHVGRSHRDSGRDSHSRRSSVPSTLRNEMNNQSRLGFISPPQQLPSASTINNHHLINMNRPPFIGNLTTTNATPLIPNPLFMTPSMLTPSTSTLIPTNLVPSGSSMPRYYNPTTFNASKYAIQEEKKKLLWGPNNKDVSQQSKKVWQGLQFSGAQGQQMTEKFLKLMGSKPTTSSGQLDNTDSMVKYQETLFNDLDKQYSAARMSTHINRGIGLGFSSNPNNKYM
ncbi:arginine/serine-rich coiled-coil protein 2-like isoform X2 [Panonychus citri]|uniref:arginine/serine-rich coiled-coil protein 2-like isoform X2 n=1 Tax=Panonychus citri TaxID=50023 RepID=UPI002307C34E|nr:arginine/serine-rich coiled-coil protein 2-like isoform X2 [Panonychus citri]